MRFTQTDERRERFSIATDFDATEVVGDDGKTTRTLVGKAIVYGQLSDDRGGYFVRIKPGAARFTTPTKALYNHNIDDILGNTANETLSITDSPDGVLVSITLPDTQLGRDTYTLVKDRYIGGMSFGVDVPSIKKTVVFESGKRIHEYNEMLVDEVTITGSPAFTATSIAAKFEEVEQKPEVEDRPEDSPTADDAAAIELEELRLAGYRIDLYEVTE